MRVLRFNDDGGPIMIILDNVKTIYKGGSGSTIYFSMGNDFTKALRLSSNEKASEVFEMIWEKLYGEPQTIDR